MDNSYNAGMTNRYNEDGWKVGVGIQVPIFSGFETLNRLKEARAGFEKMQNEQVLLREGIALQIKNIFLQMISCKTAITMFVRPVAFPGIISWFTCLILFSLTISIKTRISIPAISIHCSKFIPRNAPAYHLSVDV